MIVSVIFCSVRLRMILISKIPLRYAMPCQDKLRLYHRISRHAFFERSDCVCHLVVAAVERVDTLGAKRRVFKVLVGCRV